MKYQIGEFSHIIRLSIKTLRYYHETGILTPSEIDNFTGYRYYDDQSIEKANIIIELKNLGFSINEIKTILSGYNDDTEIKDFIVKKQKELINKINNYKKIESKLVYFLKQQGNKNIDYCPDDIIEKTVPDIQIASIRFQGKYSDAGKYFSEIGKCIGKFINGSAFSLYYDKEFKDTNADIESGFPISKSIVHSDIKTRLLKGGKALTIIHNGSYELLGFSYKKIFDYCQSNNLKTISPIKEIYHKGPGIIFRRNPKNFITEIQIYLR